MSTLTLVRRGIIIAGLIAIAIVLVTVGPAQDSGSGELGLIGGELTCWTDEDIDNGTVPLPDPNAARQRIVAEFQRTLTRDERRELEDRFDYRLRFLDSIPDRSYIVSIQTPIFADALSTMRGWNPAAICMGMLERGDRSFDILDLPEDLPGYDDVDETVPLYVKFYRDVPISRQRSFLDPIVVVSIENVPAYNDEWRIVINVADKSALENNLDIKWIRAIEFPAEEDMDEARRVIGLPGDYPNDGDGTVIAQWELCHPAVTLPAIHPDLAQRASIGSNAAECRIDVVVDQDGRKIPSNRHATQVAGIAVGSGVQSTADGGIGGQWRGVAPGSRIVSYSVVDGPGFGEEYLNAVSRGASISNNSWGPKAGDYYFETEPDPYPYRSSFYDSVASSRDAAGLPTGPGARLLIVASAGNRGAATIPANDDRYYWQTVRIRNSAKNVLTVGNVATGLNQQEGMPAFDTGRGPTSDGRLKPDLVAPGAEVGLATPETDIGIHASVYPNDSSPRFYESSWGTSFSTPVVAGAAALVSTTFRTGACARNPSSAELRALLIHAAKDLVDATADAQTATMRSYRRDQAIARSSMIESRYPAYAAYTSDAGPPTPADQALDDPPVQQDLVGPDYVFGFGLVQPVAADELVAGRHFISDRIEKGIVEYPIVVDQGSLENGETLRVTLAWDDPPFPLIARPDPETGLLQNDLDLVLIDPDGRHYFPWRLDPQNPGQPATRGSRGRFDVRSSGYELGDHRNTVEQIVVTPDKTLLGKTWRIRVSATKIRLPAQPYTLVGRSIQPAVACGMISRFADEHAIRPPSDTVYWVLLIIALVILLVLLLWLAELVYQEYLQQGRDYATGMVIVAYFFVLFVTIALWTLLTSGLDKLT